METDAINVLLDIIQMVEQILVALDVDQEHIQVDMVRLAVINVLLDIIQMVEQIQVVLDVQPVNINQILDKVVVVLVQLEHIQQVEHHIVHYVSSELILYLVLQVVQIVQQEHIILKLDQHHHLLVYHVHREHTVHLLDYLFVLIVQQEHIIPIQVQQLLLIV